jgi:hypothetical protein
MHDPTSVLSIPRLLAIVFMATYALGQMNTADIGGDVNED